jgi:RNA polymerase sigma-70 factor (ECF subfamily)
MAFLKLLSKEEKSVIEKIYIKTNKVLYGYAYDILKDKGLAEDAVHEAFIRLEKNLDKIDDPESRRTFNYMITIVENISKTMYMRRKREFSEPIKDYSENHDETF